MANDIDSSECPLCGDTNARMISMITSQTCVCPNVRCKNYCSEQRERLQLQIAKLFESSDELDFLAGADGVVLPAPGY